MSGPSIPAKSWQLALSLACLTLLAPGIATSGVKPDMATISLAGTTWAGPETDGEFTTYTFEQDGTLAYKYSNGHYRNGTWRQSGNTIYFEMNKRYAEYQGEISGDTMKGRAWNITKKKWMWQATQVR
jgi:hypothetical protein